MTMDYRALPGLVAETPYELERSSKAMVDYYVDTMKENLLKDGELTTVAIFRSETQQHVIDCRGLMDSNESKDLLAALLRKLAVDMEAIAFAFSAEAWTVKYDPKETVKIQPSDHPDRVECVMISAQYKGDKPVMRVAEIVRDQQGKIRHLLERDLDYDGDMGIEGRFAGILDGAEIDPWADAKRWG
jgi:hypothetical protein